MALPRFITNPIGKVAATAGRAYDYATPGAGTSRVTSIGRAISDPNVVYSPGASNGGPLPGGFVPVGGAPNNAAPAGGGAPGGTAGASLGGAGYGTGGGTYDPMAAQRTSWLNMFPGAVNNITQSGRDAFGSAGRTLQGGAESLFNTIKTGQHAIDTSRENVELNRLNGVKDILGFVRNGLRQGGARLATMNAGESSATGELGRAYNQLGGERMRGVGNSAFLENRNIDTQQEGLDLQRGQGQTDLHRQRDEAVATIGSQVRQQLSDLDSQGQGLGITGKIAVDQEKQRIIDEGMAQLNGVDGWLQNMLGGVSAEGGDAVRTNAVALQQGGTGNITPFDFGTFEGQKLQGPAIDTLPIYTRSRRVEAA